MRGLVLSLACVVVSGCAPDVTGFAWDLDLEVIEDSCALGSAGHSEQLQFVVNYTGNRVDLAIGADTFASGTLSGCFLSYQSVAWETEYDNAILRWQIEGEAEHSSQPGSCGLEDGLDWVGTETFTIVSSEHPQVPTGCKIEQTVKGVYAGRLE